jgi:C1A family cysteine protease
MQHAIAQHGPITAFMEVYADLYGYKKGNPPYTYDGHSGHCGSHFVLVIGYDIEQRYFAVKNSWGEGWGDGGFFYISYDEVGPNTPCTLGKYISVFEDAILPMGNAGQAFLNKFARL